MIVDIAVGRFARPWTRFREAICEVIGENHSPEKFWEIAYKWAKIYDVVGTRELIRFESEEDAMTFLLAW